MSRATWPTFLVIAVFVPAGARPARAEGTSGRTSALSWVRQPGAEECMGAPALAAAVEVRLRRRVFVPPSDAEVSVEGTIALVKKGSYRATFRVADRQGKVLGTRDFEKSATSCSALDDDLAFVVSVLIDPDGASAPAPEAPPPPPPPVAAPAPPPPRVPEAPPSPPAPAVPWRWLAGLDFGGSGGLIPDVGWVVSGAVLVTPPKWPGLHARASSYLPESHPLENNARADVTLVSGELGVCPLELRRAPVGVTACLGAVVGQLSAHGQGFSDSRGTNAVLAAAVIDAVAELDLGASFALTLSPAVIVPLSRARLAYDDASGARRTFYENGAIGASVSVGVAVGSR